MKRSLSFLLILLVLFSCKDKTEKVNIETSLSLKTAFDGKFLIGVAVNTNQITGRDTMGARMISEQFSSIVAENCMKSEVIHPEEDCYDFILADEFVDFGVHNNMFVIGHCLIWHSQLAPWFCVDENGKNVSAEILKERMKNHIQTIVSRYKGCVKGWDVVNEAFENDGSWRKTKFYEILGEEYVSLAFQYAHEADPDAELYYNDYGMDKKGRRDAVVNLVNLLKSKGIQIDAVGMQGHVGMDYPDINDFEQSIIDFGNAGVKVMITEMDMSALPTVNKTANISDTAEYEKNLNPYPNGLSAEVQTAWNARMKQFFELFFKYSDIISRVTVWGLNDNDSWRNNFPVHGRTDYPLLFDRNNQPKEVTKWLMTKH